jgi:hypothetical protein
VTYVSKLSPELARGVLQPSASSARGGSQVASLQRERDARGGHARTVVDAIDPELPGVDLRHYL